MKITLSNLGPDRRSIEILNKDERIKLDWPDGLSVLETLALREMHARDEAQHYAKRERLFAAAQQQWCKG